MKLEKKIFIEKTDDLESTTDRLINSPATTVILNIPRDSVLNTSLDNFHILKRESATGKKELIIESVDDKILELAGLAGLKARNPIFRVREMIVSDILPKPKPGLGVIRKARSTPEIVEEDVEEKTIKIKQSLMPSPVRKPVATLVRERTGSRFVWIKTLVVLILFIGGGFFVSNKYLSKATVAITLKEKQNNFNERIEVLASASGFSLHEDKITIPGETLKAKLNLQMSFPASGKEQVQEKAKGKLTVYNSYSSEVQSIVATTRFESPDHKIFRLDSKVTIPAAKIVNGKITPSSIEVTVTADKPGVEFNVAPQSHWTIPGFKGTPKYDGFYGDSGSAMSGGFVGERVVATKDDLAEARKVVAAALNDALKSQMTVLEMNKFKLLKEASDFNVLRDDVQTSAEEGKFDLFMEAEMRNLVFDEEVLKNAVVEKNKKNTSEDVALKSLNFEYSNLIKDTTSSKMTFNVIGSAVFVANINVDSLKAQLLGQSSQDLKNTIFLLPGLERANISLWPFWVKSVPKDLDNINIEIK